jgi:hypothetical protein
LWRRNTGWQRFGAATAEVLFRPDADILTAHNVVLPLGSHANANRPPGRNATGTRCPGDCATAQAPDPRRMPSPSSTRATTDSCKSVTAKPNEREAEICRSGGLIPALPFLSFCRTGECSAGGQPVHEA